MIRNPIKNIPEKYRDQFRSEQTKFIKSRVRLLCIVTIGMYFLTVVLDFLINRDDPMVIVIVAGFVLIVGGLLVLALNRRANTLFKAKLNAYIFTVILVFLLVRLGIAYSDDPILSSAVYVFTLFLVCIIIPWTPPEVIPLWLIHSIGFSTEFVYVHEMTGKYGMKHYYNGIIFIFITFLLCLIVRRKETERDVENFVLFNEVEEKNKQMDKELEWATRVHKTIIPESVSTDLVDIMVTYLPVYYIGGDYTRFVFLAEDKVTFIISDVTGHGVPGALLVNRFHSEFERIAKEGEEPGMLMKNLNGFIKEEFEGSEMYLTAFCGQLDLKRMKFAYSSYGHPPQYVYEEKEKVIRELKAQTGMLGLPVEDEGVYQDEIDVEVGGRVFLYTDGVTETVNSSGEEYGTVRLEEFIKKNHALPVGKFNRRLMDELDSFKAESFKDDICLLDVGIKAKSTLIHWPGR